MCELFKSRVTYLGHVVSEYGIKNDPEKIKGLHQVLQAVCKSVTVCSWS